MRATHVVLAVAAIAALALMLSGVGQSPTEPIAAATTKKAGLSSRAAPAYGPRLSPRRPISPLARELQSTLQLKDLHDRLSSTASRTAEEDWALAQILERCAKVEGRNVIVIDAAESRRQFLASLSPKDPTRDKRIAAFEKSREDRCAGVRGMPVTQAQINELVDKAAAAGFPMARLRVLLRQAQSGLNDEQFATLKDIIASGDPEVVMSSAIFTAYGNNSFSLRAGPSEEDLDPNAYGAAWQLAACDLGADCGPDSPQLPSACLNQGYCDVRDVRDLIWNYRATSAQQRRIAEYYPAIARIIESGDWSYFTVFRGPPVSRSMYVEKPKP